jgi:cysteine desulfurase
VNEIYLDNSATTRPYPEVVGLAARVMSDIYGNPSSMHDLGLAAGQVLAEARRQVASVLNVNDKEIIFTSGGTEANSMAVIGAARRNRNRGDHLITTVVEHSSVLNCFRCLEQEGFRVDYLAVDSRGVIDPEALRALVNEKTTLVSIMHANNETGSLQPLAEAGRIIKELNRSAIFHIDAVQSFARLPLKTKEWQADLITCSSHKIHGPRGVGCLWVNRGVQLEPLLYGGGQEKGLRPGTENTPAIAGFGLAAEMTAQGQDSKVAQLMALKLALIGGLHDRDIHFKINGPDPAEGAPHILNLSFPGVKAEVLLHSLEAKGIYVSAGSACHSRRPEPSHVLESIGLEEKLLKSALRFSFSSMNCETEADRAAAGVAEAVRELQNM